ncbi:MAG TPA: hypothetical protein PLA43_06785 [Bryobacteraceae bacterium]|nr:hypothetical protein [Bryobacteraceae bacterium]HPU71645.1 hypothetical protein [Bryobacteraceae bacterium]
MLLVPRSVRTPGCPDTRSLPARLMLALIAAALAIAPAACKRPQPRVEPIEDGNQPALSSLHAANLRAATQFLEGVHELENNTFRWTQRRFSVVLQPPAGAEKAGARLEFRFVLPESVISRRKAVTLSAAIEGHALKPETYTAEGEHVYVRDVPASAFTEAPVKADFELDKYLAAGEVETRELGILFLSASLLPR